MLDVEHVVLYNRSTLVQLFENSGYDVLQVFGVRNTYPVAHWAYLAPMPRPRKEAVRWFLHVTGLGRLRLRVNLGSMGVIARKPK